MWLTVLSITQLATVAFPASDRNAYLAPVRMIVFIVAGHISRFLAAVWQLVSWQDFPFPTSLTASYLCVTPGYVLRVPLADRRWFHSLSLRACLAISTHPCKTSVGDASVGPIGS